MQPIAPKTVLVKDFSVPQCKDFIERIKRHYTAISIIRAAQCWMVHYALKKSSLGDPTHGHIHPVEWHLHPELLSQIWERLGKAQNEAFTMPNWPFIDGGSCWRSYYDLSEWSKKPHESGMTSPTCAGLLWDISSLWAHAENRIGGENRMTCW